MEEGEDEDEEEAWRGGNPLSLDERWCPGYGSYGNSMAFFDYRILYITVNDVYRCFVDVCFFLVFSRSQHEVSQI